MFRGKGSSLVDRSTLDDRGDVNPMRFEIIIARGQDRHDANGSPAPTLLPQISSTSRLEPGIKSNHALGDTNMGIGDVKAVLRDVPQALVGVNPRYRRPAILNSIDLNAFHGADFAGRFLPVTSSVAPNTRPGPRNRCTCNFASPVLRAKA
jgi:hypothetical protein